MKEGAEIKTNEAKELQKLRAGFHQLQGETTRIVRDLDQKIEGLTEERQTDREALEELRNRIQDVLDDIEQKLDPQQSPSLEEVTKLYANLSDLLKEYNEHLLVKEGSAV